MHHEMKTSIQAHGVTVGREALAVWNGHLVEIFEINHERNTLRSMSKFADSP